MWQRIPIYAQSTSLTLSSLVALAMCAIEFAERASYYGTSGPFNNFINNPLPIGGNGAGAVAHGDAGLNQSAGALGMGSVSASAITKMFSFLAYVIPIFGGIVADNVSTHFFFFFGAG